MTPSSSCNSVTVRRFAGDEWPLYRALRLRSLDDAPGAFGSTLAREQALADQDWAWRLGLAARSGRDHPLLAEVDGAAAGLAWAKFDANDPQLVNLFQMWVAPECRGRGVAAALLAEALVWARSRRARTMGLGVMGGNHAAARLYERAGFKPFGEPEPARPGDARMEQAMRLDL